MTLQAPEHLRRHPWGKIPAITTSEGFTLYESRAICKFLAAKYNFPLLPPSSDLIARALFDQAESIEICYFAPHVGAISFEKFAKPIIGLAIDETVVAQERKKLEDYSNIIDEILARQEYMAGNDFSLVDIYYIPLVERLFACGEGDLISSKKNINAWWERCMTRPAVKKFVDRMPKLAEILERIRLSKSYTGNN